MQETVNCQKLNPNLVGLPRHFKVFYTNGITGLSLKNKKTSKCKCPKVYQLNPATNLIQFSNIEWDIPSFPSSEEKYMTKTSFNVWGEFQLFGSVHARSLPRTNVHRKPPADILSNHLKVILPQDFFEKCYFRKNYFIVFCNFPNVTPI